MSHPPPRQVSWVMRQQYPVGDRSTKEKDREGHALRKNRSRGVERFDRRNPMNTIVEPRHGKVRGSIADGVNTFKGIPYAAPPFGPNRFRPPQPVEPWSGVREAITYGPKAPQESYPPQVAAILLELASVGEDCLSLNIWTSDLG